jgi:hypothetical protein
MTPRRDLHAIHTRSTRDPHAIQTPPPLSIFRSSITPRPLTNSLSKTFNPTTPFIRLYNNHLRFIPSVLTKDASKFLSLIMKYYATVQRLFTTHLPPTSSPNFFSPLAFHKKTTRVTLARVLY